MNTTKEQERKALEKIRTIVDGLGENSYVATAFAGCFEIAEQNIEYDFADSLQERLKIAELERDKAKSESKFYMEEHNKVQSELETTKALLDKELEWKDCPNMGTQMTQADYEHLEQCGETLTEEKAKALIADEFGFDPRKIEIITKVNTYEVNKHSYTRKKETYTRAPINCSTDWNYIRFNCSNWYYEMIDGQLRQYYC
ncbi:MAG: hypothetical protein NC401_06460 [Ruminococcus sp.]|nr:hypothetical protein [Ruminococcus sp.]